MAVVVEHEKRKREILEKALDVFIEEGYEGATFQKIADKCAITRTILYTYFKNKREIFLWSIKQLVSSLEGTLTKTLNDDSLCAEDCLRAMLMAIIDKIESSAKLFSVLLVYLLQLKKTGVNPHERVQRRVLRLRHFLSAVIIRGIKDGEFRQIAVKDADNLFYSLIESVIFRLSMSGPSDFIDARASINLAVDGIVSQRERPGEKSN